MTKKIKEIVYGIGGFDESKPDNNVVETLYYTAAELTEIAQADESWNRALHLVETVKQDELLTTDQDVLLHRLFWEETLLAFKPQPVSWKCSCTRERVADMLRMLGQPEVESILLEQGKIEVACEFCAQPYLFDAIDADGLFQHITAPGSKSLH